MENYGKISGFWVKEDEKSMLKYIIPQDYIDGSLKNNSLDEKYALGFMRTELDELLHSFVNGGFSNAGFVFYPLMEGISSENKKRMDRLRRLASFLEKKGYDFSSSMSSGGNGSLAFAKSISCFYGDISKIKSGKRKVAKKPKCGEFEIKDCKDVDYMGPVNGLKEYASKSLKPYLSGFYLHGSLATRDYVRGWSDLDTLGIVTKKTIDSAKLILELRKRMYSARRFFYQVDPLQHHGSIILSEYGMDDYSEARFPLEIFRYSLSLLGKDREMVFRLADSRVHSLSKLFWFVSYFRGMRMAQGNMNSYDAKNLLHSCTLFPSLYLMAKGKAVYKKFSFGVAEKDFSREEWAVIRYVESLRSSWKPFGVLPGVKALSRANPLLYYHLNCRIVGIFSGIVRKNDVDTRKIIDGMHSLSESAWEKVRKDARL